MHLSNITTQRIIYTSHNATLAIQCIGRLTKNCLFIMLYRQKCRNRVSEWKYEWLTFWYIVPQVCYWNSILLFRPSKLSDLPNFLTFKTFWPSCGCSESTCTKLYNDIINPRHQADNYVSPKYAQTTVLYTCYPLMLTVHTITSYM